MPPPLPSHSPLTSRYAAHPNAHQLHQPVQPPPPAAAPAGPSGTETLDALAHELRLIAREQLSLLNGNASPPRVPSPPLPSASAPSNGLPRVERHGASTPNGNHHHHNPTPPPSSPPAPLMAVASGSGGVADAHETVRLLHESRADALEQLHASQARAREAERRQMGELMGELQAWKKENEQRMEMLASRSNELSTPRLPPSKLAPKFADNRSDSPPDVATHAAPLPAATPAESRVNGGASGAAKRGGRDDAFRSLRTPRATEPAPSSSGRENAAERLRPEVASSLRWPAAEQPTAATPQSGVGSRPPLGRGGGGALSSPHHGDYSSRRVVARGAGDPPEESRSLRALQKELDSLKSSLSVYLGSGLL